MSQLQGQRAEEEGGGAEGRAGGPVAVLVLPFAFVLLAEDPLEARRAEAALALVAGAPVLAQQELVVADVRWGRKREEAVGGLSSRG